MVASDVARAASDFAQLHRVVTLGLQEFDDDVEDPVIAVARARHRGHSALTTASNAPCRP